MKIIEEVINKQDISLLLNLSPDECRRTGGCRYILSKLKDNVPDHLLAELVVSHPSNNEELQQDLLNFLKVM